MRTPIAKPMQMIMIFILIIGLILLLKNVNNPQKTNSDASETETAQTVELDTPTDPNMREFEAQVVDRLKDFPVFPKAVIEESSERINSIESNQDLHAEWVIYTPVKEVMDWYMNELPKNGWTVEPPNDALSTGEQVAHISKGNLNGYIAVEDEGEGKTEIVVDFKVLSQ